jgi:hypothetical protein
VAGQSPYAHRIPRLCLGGKGQCRQPIKLAEGDTSGTYSLYACIEMDDAVIAQACKTAGTAFGFVRNISDPVQNAALPPKAQGNWGSAIYDAYGFYTSYNGALAAWAMLVG